MLTQLPLILGSIVGVWAMLTILGGERTRKIGEHPQALTTTKPAVGQPAVKPEGGGKSMR